jgi:hypothetical protein
VARKHKEVLRMPVLAATAIAVTAGCVIRRSYEMA